MFDFDKFLKTHWASPTQLAHFVWQYGYRELTLDAFRKWFQRATVPAEWLPILLILLEMDRGKPVRLALFFTPRKAA